MSLEHLGVIAARLRKDVTTPTSEAENDELVDVMAQVKVSKLDSATPSPTALAPMVSCFNWAQGSVQFVWCTSIF